MTESEKILSAFSQMYFFEEIVQDNLQFVSHDGSTQELADLLLNMGDSIIAIQIKERSDSARTTDSIIEKKWFDKKMSLAKKQIKTTMSFIKEGKIPAFQNKRGITKIIRADAEIIPLVIFLNESITEYPHILERHSETGLTVNCMSFADFQVMCSELISPAEMIDYLKYRCGFYEANGPVNVIIREFSENDMLIIRPAANETLLHLFLIEKYGIDELKQGNEQFELFRWFVRQTAERSIVGRDNFATYSILLFLMHFRRNEIKEFMKRLILARDKAKAGNYGIAGSLRRGDSYAIFFVSSPPHQSLSMEYLSKLARRKCNPQKLLQVYAWWEDNENYRIDYILQDPTQQDAEQ